MSSRTRIEKEAKDNSEMAYLGLGEIGTQTSVMLV